MLSFLIKILLLYAHYYSESNETQELVCVKQLVDLSVFVLMSTVSTTIIFMSICTYSVYIVSTVWCIFESMYVGRLRVQSSGSEWWDDGWG